MMEIGKRVRLKAYGGEIIERRVVAVEGDTVAVCTEKEYAQAAKEGREPLSVGFRREYVIAQEPTGE